MRIEWDQRQARCDLVALCPQEHEAKADEGRLNAMVPIHVAFSPILGTKYNLGLGSFRVMGHAQAGSIRSGGQRALTDERLASVEVKQGKGKKVKAGAGVAEEMPAIANIGSEREHSTQKKVAFTEKQTTTTFLEFRSGSNAEWHFKRGLTNPLIDGGLLVDVVFSSSGGSAGVEGHFMGDPIPGLSITRTDGTPLSDVKQWMIRSKLLQDKLLNPIYLRFRGQVGGSP